VAQVLFISYENYRKQARPVCLYQLLQLCLEQQERTSRK
jgi:hypothetical protein